MPSLCTVLLFIAGGSTTTCLLVASGHYYWPTTIFWVAFLICTCLLMYWLERPTFNARVKVNTKELFGIIAIISLATLSWLYDHDSWKYSLIGDETGFYIEAVTLSTRPIGSWDFLNAFRVFDDHPRFVTVIQATFIAAFGANGLSWKLSCATMEFLCVPFLFIYMKSRAGARNAIFALIVFSFSILVTDWAKIGKPHAFMLLPVSAMIAVSDAFEAASLTGAFLTGVVAGLGSLCFILAALTGAAYLALMSTLEIIRSPRWKTFGVPSFRIVGFICGSAPILAQHRYLTHLFTKNLGTFSASTAAQNTVHTFLAFLHFESSDHFIFGEVTDVVSALFIALGAIYAIRQRRTQEIVLWISCVIVAGTLAYYNYPPVTRIILLAVPWTLLSAYGALAISLSAEKNWIRNSTLAVAGCAIMVLDVRAFAQEAGRSMNSHQILVFEAQENPSVQFLAIVPRRWNLDIENDALRYNGITNASFIKADQVPDALNNLRSLEVTAFVAPNVRITENESTILKEGSVRLIGLQQTMRRNLPPTIYDFVSIDPSTLVAEEIDPESGEKKAREEIDEQYIRNLQAQSAGRCLCEKGINGLLETRFEGSNWATKTDVTSLQFTGRQSQLINESSKDDFSLVAEGCFVINSNENCNFTISSDDGSFLIVDGYRILRDLGVHSELEASASYMLPPGVHSFYLGYYQEKGVAKLTLDNVCGDAPIQYFHCADVALVS